MIKASKLDATCIMRKRRHSLCRSLAPYISRNIKRCVPIKLSTSLVISSRLNQTGIGSDFLTRPAEMNPSSLPMTHW